MPVETITVGTLINRVGFALTNSATVEAALSTEIQYAVNFAVRDMIFKTNHPAFRVEANITVTSGTSDYPLPDDFFRIVEPGVRHDASPKWTLRYFEQQDYDEIHGAQWFNSNDRPRFFTIRGKDDALGCYYIRFVPTPDATYNLKYTYFARPKDVSTTATTENIDRRFPMEFVQGVVWGAALMFPQYLGVDQQATYQAKYVEAIRDMSFASRPVVGQITHQKRYEDRDRQDRLFDLPNTLVGPSDLVT